jgi:signal peptidase II
MAVAVKHMMLTSPDWNGAVLVPGLLDLHYAWNHGISFSLFWQTSALGSAALQAVLLFVILGAGVLALRAHRLLLAIGLGLVTGGGLGNMIDRVTDGAVFDFLVVHLGRMPLFICNTGDIFISLGAILLLVDMIREPG